MRHFNILITGTSRGIGLELAKTFLEQDHTVIAIARKPKSSDGLKKLKSEYDSNLLIFEADVSDADALKKIQKEIRTLPVDILINNAGVYDDADGPLPELDLEVVASTLAINSIAPMRVTQTFLPNLQLAVTPKVANITSQMGSIEDNSSGGYYAYRMSKAALNMFTKSLAKDFPKLTVLSLHPGWVKTDMGGPQAPTPPSESAAGLYKVIMEAKPQQSGTFLNYKGAEIKW